MSLADLKLEDFAPHVGTDFVLAGGETTPPLPFTLIAAVPLAKAPRADLRDQFRLTFRIPLQDIWPQGTYRLTHATMGENDIFLVPADRTPDGVEYCATFT